MSDPVHRCSGSSAKSDLRRIGTLNCLLFNARSLRNKIEEFSDLLHLDNYDIIFVTETWFDHRITDSFVVRDSGYTLFRCDRSSSMGGGCAIFTKDHIRCEQVAIPVSFSEIEVVAVDVMCSRSIRYRIFCIYFPPQSTMSADHVSSLCELLEFGCSGDRNTLFIGDFNFPLIDWSVPTAIGGLYHRLFLQTCVKLNLFQLVDSPTRGGNIIDLILTNNPHVVQSLSVIHPFSVNCDHDSVSFSLIGISPHLTEFTKKPNFFAADYDQIKILLQNISWYDIYRRSLNVQDFWNSIHRILKDIISNSSLVPHFVQRRRYRYPKSIYLLLSKKYRLYTKMQSDPSAKSAYKDACVQYKNAVHDFNRNVELNIIRRGNTKVLYSFINKKLKHRSVIPPISNAQGELIWDSKFKADLFNSYFGSVYSIDDSTLPDFDTRVLNDMECSFIYFSPEAVNNKLKHLPNKFIYTPDGLPPVFLRNLADELTIPFQILFEFSFCTGCLPEIWKLSTIIPYHKKGNRSYVQNYRPISLTSVACKLMESIITDQLSTYLRNNDLISCEQHGFLKKRSTCTQLINSLNTWISSINSRHQVDVIYIDFLKAFDKLCHNKLLHKLKCYGITYELLGWISAFVSERRQQVMIANCFSIQLQVNSGVPQGSVLGPLLFLVYVNDIVTSVTADCKLLLFADDLKVFTCGTNSNFENLQMSLSLIVDWSHTWQLPIAEAKCRVISFGGHKEEQYSIANFPLTRSTTVCDLGVTFTSNLKFTKHCETISSKAMARAYLILKCFVSNDRSLLKQAYFVYVRPLLEYCTQVWNPILKKDIIMIEKVQKYFTRRICQRSNINYTDYKSRLYLLDMFSLERRRIIFDLILVYRMFHRLIDLNFDDFFSLLSSDHETRGHHLRLRTRNLSRCTCHEFFFCHRIVNVWNSLPSYIISSSSLYEFKKKLHNFDLSPQCKVYF